MAAIAAAGLLMAIVAFVMTQFESPAVVYRLAWDTTGVEVEAGRWSVMVPDGSHVVVTRLEVVTSSAELMPCVRSAPNVPGTDVGARIRDLLIGTAWAGHSGIRNGIAIPEAVVELPLVRPSLDVAAALPSPGPWCRTHWLTARRDEGTIAPPESVLPDRTTYLIEGFRRATDGSTTPFSVTSRLAHGDYYDLGTPLEVWGTEVIVIERNARAVVESAVVEATPRDLERGVLRALVERTVVCVAERSRQPGCGAEGAP